MAKKKKFCETLLALRTAAGLTQAQLGEKSGIHPITVVKIENDQGANPKWDTVCALAQAMGADLGDFDPQK